MATDERTDSTPQEDVKVLEIKFPEQKELEDIFDEWRMYFPLQRITIRSSSE